MKVKLKYLTLFHNLVPSDTMSIPLIPPCSYFFAFYIILHVRISEISFWTKGAPLFPAIMCLKESLLVPWSIMAQNVTCTLDASRSCQSLLIVCDKYTNTYKWRRWWFIDVTILHAAHLSYLYCRLSPFSIETTTPKQRTFFEESLLFFFFGVDCTVESEHRSSPGSVFALCPEGNSAGR